MFITFRAQDPDLTPLKSYLFSYSWSHFVHIIFIFVYIPWLGPLSIPQSKKHIDRTSMFLDVNSAHVRLAVAMDTTQKNPSEVDSAISTEHLGRSISGM